MAADFLLGMISVICENLCNLWTIKNTFTPWGCWRFVRKGLEGVANPHCGFASGVCASRKLHGLYPVWSFASGKTPEGIAATRQFLSPAKPGFRCKAPEMRPNFKKSS
jgi:hypothetical protein